MPLRIYVLIATISTFNLSSLYFVKMGFPNKRIVEDYIEFHIFINITKDMKPIQRLISSVTYYNFVTCTSILKILFYFYKPRASSIFLHVQSSYKFITIRNLLISIFQVSHTRRHM